MEALGVEVLDLMTRIVGGTSEEEGVEALFKLLMGLMRLLRVEGGGSGGGQVYNEPHCANALTWGGNGGGGMIGLGAKTNVGGGGGTQSRGIYEANKMPIIYNYLNGLNKVNCIV